MPIQLLQTTSIGVAINGVCKSCSDKKVMSLAKVLIKNWKQLLNSPGLPSLPPSKGEKGEEGDKTKKEKELTIPTGWKPEGRIQRQERLDGLQLFSHFLPKRPLMERSNSNPSTLLQMARSHSFYAE
uniref:TFIIS N-terminal domain-containing protein n=2 Tax=Canis lupus familiaris TaxID=9615 RepID=A0A8C0P941_CANLF